VGVATVVVSEKRDKQMLLIKAKKHAFFLLSSLTGSTKQLYPSVLG
jgi:hypothetical protein